MEAAASGERLSPAQVGKKKKRFQCPHCQRLFARLEHLQRHERIHSGVKPFRCVECNYSFTRSDLLVRHERLTHHKEQSNTLSHQQLASDGTHSYAEAQPEKRIRTSNDDDSPFPEIPGMMSPPVVSEMRSTLHQSPISLCPITCGNSSRYSLTTLSMAAEYQALQGTITGTIVPPVGLPTSTSLQSELIAKTVEPPHPILPAEPSLISQGPTLEESLDSLTSFLDNEPLNSYDFASLFSTEQPMPFFSPDSFDYGQDFLAGSETVTVPMPGWKLNHVEDPHSISRFGSRLPSLQPNELAQATGLRSRSIADISHGDRQTIAEKLSEFSAIIPKDFKLPTRLALCRYIAAYINGFHEHMPFLHIPSMSVRTCSIELILALAAIGAQYTFEGEKGVELFHVSREIATYRIRRRDSRLVELQRFSDLDPETSTRPSSQRSGSISGILYLPSQEDGSVDGEDLMQTAQALLLLMALCTWVKHKEILREALAIQSIIATLIRDDGLKDEPLDENISWENWIRRETIKRTKFIVYGFSNLHCIVYNIPPFLLTSEILLALPCCKTEFKAPTEALWRESRKEYKPEVLFQDALKRLFSKNGRNVTECNSSSGNYALMHALIQHIFFLRQVARCRYDGAGDLSSEDVSALEVALGNWQIGWRQNPESSLDPISPDGPVAFNSTALLRLAYIRLYVDTAGRALETRDPLLIANAMRAGPAIKRSSKITRAVLHSAHALSIPIKIGYRLVAKTQTFIWSIQHSLCTLECAYLMSKWLEALSVPNPDPPSTDDENRIVAIVKSMLDETEFAVPPEISAESPDYTKHLSAGVLRVWALIFKGSQTWAIVDVIGSALNLYADMLQSD